jgi:outer membrane protein assembly factor BamB
MRRLVPYVLLLGVLSLGACSGGDEPAADPAPSESSTPTPAPTETETPAEPAGPVLTEPTWVSARAYPGIPVALWPVDDGFVGATTGAVVGLDATGGPRWLRRGLDTVQTWSAGEVVVMYDDRGVTALDAGTGRQLWTTAASSVTADQDRVYVATCSGGCELTARSFATGEVLWSSPTYDGLDELTLVGDEIVAETSRVVASALYQPFDRATGAWTGAAIEGHARVALVPGVVVAGGEADPDASDGCVSTVRGVTTDGVELWAREMAVEAEKGEKGEKKATCPFPTFFTPGPTQDVAASVPGRASLLLDPRTGRTVLRTEPGQDIDVAAARVVVTERDAPNGRLSIAAVDRRTGEPLWSTDDLVTPWRVVDDGRLQRSYQCEPECHVELADLRTGETIAAALGQFIDVGRTAGVDWMAVELELFGQARGRFGYVELP